MLNLGIIEEKLLEIRNKKVLLDRDVAYLYGIETKRVNEAVKNNPEKFPEGYVIYLDEEETDSGGAGSGLRWLCVPGSGQ